MKKEKTEDKISRISRLADEYITETDIRIEIRIPEGTQSIKIVSNCDLGSVTTMYLLMKAFIAQGKILKRKFGEEYGTIFDWPTIARQMGDMVEEEINAI